MTLQSGRVAANCRRGDQRRVLVTGTGWGWGGLPPTRPGDGKREAPVTGHDARLRLSASSDPYLLRMLIWCGPCDLSMNPNREADGEKRRIYTCGFNCRRQQHLLADAIESITWTAAERRAAINAIAAPYRKSVLEILLVKVVIGATAADVDFVWRI